MTVALPPVRCVYVAAAPGTLLLQRRVVQPRPARVGAAGSLAGHCLAPLPVPSPQSMRASWVALDLAELLGCLLGINLMGIVRFLSAV